MVRDFLDALRSHSQNSHGGIPIKIMKRTLFQEDIGLELT